MSKEKTRESLAEKLKLTTYSEMLGLGDNVAEDENKASVEGKLVELPLSELHTFKNHPFQVLDDAKMEETVESIKQYGVLVPGLVRERKEGGYEILAGHRRRRASELAGKDSMPVLIKNVSDDEAIIIMVDSNIQREDLLPSEKAKAYAMKFEALRHQGKIGGGLSIQQIGESTGESAKTVQRYIQLSRLSDELLQMVDEKKIGFGQGCDLSFLDEAAQSMAYETLVDTNCSISGVQSALMKTNFKDGILTVDKIREILNQKKTEVRKVVINSKRLDSYFTPNYSTEEIEELIIKLLDEWKTKEGSEA